MEEFSVQKNHEALEWAFPLECRCICGSVLCSADGFYCLLLLSFCQCCELEFLCGIFFCGSPRLMQHCTVGTTLAVVTCLVLVIPTGLQSENWDLEKPGVPIRESLILCLWWSRSLLPPRSWGGVCKWWWPALGFAVIFNSCSIPRLSDPAPPFFHSCSFLVWAVSYSLRLCRVCCWVCAVCSQVQQ